ncbi:MAG: TRAP transporter TatT component family protein [Nannocystales bacterium]
MKKTLILVAVSMALSACSGRKAVWDGGSTEPPAAGDTAAAAAAGDTVSAGDAKWAERTDAANIRAAIAEWEKVAAATPGDAEVLVKLTRAHYFLADGYLRAEDDEKEYLKMMDKGVKWGEKAMVAASPEFAAAMKDGKKFPEAVKLVGKDGVPALYWYASSLGKWAKKKGFAVLLGQKDNVKATMDRCLELDPTFYYGGPHRYFGAFYAIAPAFAGGDLEKSKVHFKKSLEIAPNFVGTKVLWAAELATKTQDEATFDTLIAEIEASKEDAIPEVLPELRIEMQKGAELKANRDDLF